MLKLKKWHLASFLQLKGLYCRSDSLHYVIIHEILTIPSVTFRTLLSLFCFMNTDSCSDRCPSHISTIITLLIQHVTRINRGRPLDSSAWNVSTIIISTAWCSLNGPWQISILPPHPIPHIVWSESRWSETELKNFPDSDFPAAPVPDVLAQCW